MELKPRYGKRFPKKSKEQLHKELHYKFEAIIRVHYVALLPYMASEFQFDPVRKFKFDYCFPAWKVAIDLQGGIYSHGRRSGHTSVKGMENDMDKINLAQNCGWVMFQLSPRKLDKPHYVVSLIKDALTLQATRMATRQC